MPRKSKKYHYLYKTINLLNNKFYIGIHSTNDMQDGYLGSGTHLRHVIKKYGKDNFKIEYLKFLKNRNDLILEEKQFLTNEILNDILCMNIREGGISAPLGNTFASGKRSEETRIKMRKPKSEEHRKNITKANTGRKYSKESKEKRRIKWLGELNPMRGKFGTLNPNFGKKRPGKTNKGKLLGHAKHIAQYKNGELIKAYPSICRASEETNIPICSIRLVANKKPRYKTAGGFYWEWILNI